MFSGSTGRKCGAMAAAVFAAAGLTVSSLAEPGQGAGKGPEALSGPKVEDHAPPGAGPGFGGSPRGRREGGMTIPMPVFMRSVQAALGEDAPEGVRATPEQMARVRAVLDEFNREQREFMREHAEELRRLRAAGAEVPRPLRGGRPGSEGEPMRDRTDPMSDEDRAAMMERLRELRERGPKPEDSQKKVWTLLTPAQQAAVQARLDEWRAELQRIEAERYAQRQVQQMQGRDRASPPARPALPGRERPAAPGAGAAPGGDAPASPAPMGPEMRERFQRLLERLSPEEREQLLQRLEERLRERGAPLPGAPRRPRPGPGGPQESPPPPSMRDVPMPPMPAPPPAPPPAPARP
jgi:DNA-binding MarR family transcriptional regulator